MSELPGVHPTVRLDDTVTQINESYKHWAIKAALVDRLRSDPEYEGVIETEKKTGEIIADIRATCTRTPAGIPRQFVVEIETTASQKDRLRATVEHLRFGYGVFWVFIADAHRTRQNTEVLLGDYMSAQPSFGIAALEEGELSLGSPIVWEEFTLPTPELGRHELYIPTYDRGAAVYDHGDFQIDGERLAVYRRPGEGIPYVSRYDEHGQRTLPERAPWPATELMHRIRTGEVRRVSPVRGAP